MAIKLCPSLGTPLFSHLAFRSLPTQLRWTGVQKLCHPHGSSPPSAFLSPHSRQHTTLSNFNQSSHHQFYNHLHISSKWSRQVSLKIRYIFCHCIDPATILLICWQRGRTGARVLRRGRVTNDLDGPSSPRSRLVYRLFTCFPIQMALYLLVLP